MLNIVLYEPEIPPNTGNIMRLCANTGCRLHLIEPLGFDLDEKKLRRAGLDYREFAEVATYQCWQTYLQSRAETRVFAISTKGATRYSETRFMPGDSLLFGPESRGLPADILRTFPPDRLLRIPMVLSSRSLNLSNAAAVIAYEALRQLNFRGLT